jgi:hypothetical protein
VDRAGHWHGSHPDLVGKGCGLYAWAVGSPRHQHDLAGRGLRLDHGLGIAQEFAQRYQARQGMQRHFLSTDQEGGVGDAGLSASVHHNFDQN